ncbi:MAG: hypothetical protein R6U62_04055 [Bacteroidales bacterium]
MQKIDAHLHLDLAGMDARRLIRYMDRRRIEKGWLHTWEELAPPIKTLYQNLPPEVIFEAFEQYPHRIVPFYAPDPGSNHPEQKLQYYLDKGLKGCGELKVTFQWQDPAIENYLEILSRYRLPLLFHMEAPRMHYAPKKSGVLEKLLDPLMNGAFNGVANKDITLLAEKTGLLRKHLQNRLVSFPGYLHDFAGLEKRLRQFPDIAFIAHGPHFWNNISDRLSGVFFHEKGPVERFGIIDRLLSSYDNLYCDISGKGGFNALNRDHRQSKRFLEMHYPKILFGTDNTGLDYDGLIDSMNLTEKARKMLFFENAESLIPA